MKTWAAILLFLVGAARAADLKALYEAHKWFELREAMREDGGSPLYRIAAAAAFGDVKRADDEFRAMLRLATDAEAQQIQEAAVLLVELHGRSGQYRNVIPGAKAPELGRIPNLTVVARVPSLVRGEVESRGYLTAPLSINGRPTRLVIDTGAGLSTITESEARRLGLSAVAGKPPFSWFAGAESKGRLAVARRLEIGKFRFRDVAFAVVPDAQLAGFSTEVRGALGFPVLLAMETMRWNRNGEIEFGFPFHATGETNLCFNGWGPAARIDFQQRKIYVALDTGNPATVWWPPLSRDFPTVLERSDGDTTLDIAGGNPPEIKAAIVPSLRFGVGDFHVVHDNAPIHRSQTTRDSAYYAGNLGLDLLMQAHRITIDFKALVLSLE